MANNDENMKRLIASVEANHVYIAERLKEICQEEDCDNCKWYNRNIDIGCVWRVVDDLAPLEWRTDNDKQ